MKTIILFFIVTLFTSTSKAQISKGSWLIGANGQYNSTHSFGTTSSGTIVNFKSNQLQVVANIGYYLLDKLAFGLKPSFTWQKENPVSGLTGSSGNDKVFAIGPFGRYYFLNQDKPYNLVADIYYLFGTLRDKYLKGSSKEFSFTAGPVIFFNNCVSIELLAGYHSVNITYGTQTLDEGFQYKIGFQIHLQQ